MNKILGFIVCLLVLIHGGCTGLLQPSTKLLHEYIEQSNNQELFFEPYIGHTTDEILSLFGKPNKAYKADPPGYNLPYEADEMWRYKNVETKLPNDFKFFYDFLFKDEKLFKVMVD